MARFRRPEGAKSNQISISVSLRQGSRDHRHAAKTYWGRVHFKLWVRPWKLPDQGILAWSRLGDTWHALGTATLRSAKTGSM